MPTDARYRTADPGTNGGTDGPTAGPDPAEGGVPLAAKVAFLRHAGSYPDHPAHVDAVETHMSWVFLTERHAYKLKKPVRSPVLDFSTVEARKTDCDAEVRLNRRLAANAYLGVVPLAVRDDGGLELGGTRRPVDWIVHMIRLPTRHRLDEAIRTRRVRGADAIRLGQVLARFYAGAARQDRDPDDYVRGFEADIAVNVLEIEARVPPGMAACARAAAASQGAFLNTHGDLLRERARQGRIVEAHGDLRPEHIFLNSEPAIIDCLEFNRALRLLDPADELAFLALECERLDATWIGDVVFDVYRTVSGDKPPPAMVEFFRSFRACVRARLAARRLDEPDGRRTHWLEKAQAYLGLALRHAERLPQPGISPPEAR